VTGIRRIAGTIAAASAAAIVVVGTVAAHGAGTGLYPDRPTTWPGGSVAVRGDVPSTGPIELVLVDGTGSTGGVLVARIEDAPNGHFDVIVTVPTDLEPGSWSLEARAAGMPATTTVLELTAAPPPDVFEDEGPVAEADAGPVQSQRSSPTIPAVPSPMPTTETDVVPFVAAALAALALAVLVRRTGRSAPAR
jgi:hypothetical protein